MAWDAAWLHDVVEDTDATLADLEALGFEPEVVEIVDALSRRPDETYGAYLGRVKANPVARRVKLADLQDNMDPDRAFGEGWESLMRRYRQSVEFLS